MLIFLDIDGVLATKKSYREGTFPLLFDKNCVEQLNSLLAEVECDVVISSTWGKHYNVAELNSIFSEQGIKKEIISITPSISFRSQRGQEIKQWLEDNNRESEYYIAIDDEPIDDLSEENKLIIKDGFEQDGLTQYYKNQVIKKINSQFVNCE